MPLRAAGIVFALGAAAASAHPWTTKAKEALAARPAAHRGPPAGLRAALGGRRLEEIESYTAECLGAFSVCARPARIPRADPKGGARRRRGGGADRPPAFDRARQRRGDPPRSEAARATCRRDEASKLASRGRRGTRGARGILGGDAAARGIVRGDEAARGTRDAAPEGRVGSSAPEGRAGSSAPEGRAGSSARDARDIDAAAQGTREIVRGEANSSADMRDARGSSAATRIRPRTRATRGPSPRKARPPGAIVRSIAGEADEQCLKCVLSLVDQDDDSVELPAGADAWTCGSVVSFLHSQEFCAALDADSTAGGLLCAVWEACADEKEENATPYGRPARNSKRRRRYSVGTSRGAAAAASWIFRGDESRRRRGRELDILWRRVAPPPRVPRG